MRALWLVFHGSLDHADGEAANAAIAIARGDGMADTFARGSGASAHFMPSMTLVAGAVYAVLGIRTAAAELVLATLSVGLSLVSAWLWYRIVQMIGIPRAAALTGLTLFCFLPLSISLEVIDFRAWEGALAATLGALALLPILNRDRADRPWVRSLWLPSLLAAINFFVNPAMGLAVFGALALLLLRRFAARQWPQAIAIAALCLVVVLTPWAVRNELVLGRFIPLRGNAGLELALANHPAAAASGDQRQIFVERLHEIHPLESQPAFDRMMRMGGEIPYAAALGKTALQWIAEHPR
ncbi:MAG TPA: hypothetical protein VE567_09960, partial [Sphingomonas sp.]|nr:hypothetical protein [Sphingomonas sp.]